MKVSKGKLFLIVFAAFIILLIVGLLFKPSAPGALSPMLIFGMLVVGLVLGGVIVYLIVRNMKPDAPAVRVESHTLAESLRKVFKVVTAEGQFSEIYNYEDTTKLLKFIPSKKKALVIVEAKVLIGYDFEKLKWELDSEQQHVRLIHFPPPEILSTETDYKYYNIEEQFFNLFSREDLSNIQNNGKKQVIEAAKQSRLPIVAAEQIRTLLTELLSAKGLSLQNPELILSAAAPQALPPTSPTES